MNSIRHLPTILPNLAHKKSKAQFEYPQREEQEGENGITPVLLVEEAENPHDN